MYPLLTYLSQQRPSQTAKKNRLLTHFDECCDRKYSGTVTVLRLDSFLSFEAAVNALRSTQVGLAQEKINDHRSITCAHSKRKGHVRESCFSWIDTPDGTKWAAKNPQKAAKVIKKREEYKERRSQIGSSNHAQVLDEGLWLMGESISPLSSGESSNDVILDTGAIHHVFYNLSAFTSFSPIQKSIQTDSGNCIDVTGIGSVEFKVFDLMGRNNGKVIEIDDVWHVPNCTKNLLSGTQLVNNGFGISSSRMGLSVTSSTGSIIATARPVAGLFCFKTSRHLPSMAPDNFIGFC
ncbi:hypothetical protein K3495_g14431 [Podosphaera aphanis]|nr:hypothetical protein K3495_g14431 [Podosphaera aphanis]